jgi:hypothetical protein
MMSLQDRSSMEGMMMCAAADAHHRVSRRIQAAADGPAMVLAVATAVPPFVHPTSTYPDYYFDMTNCNHMTALKDKFQRICTSHIQWTIFINLRLSLVPI